MKITKDSVSTCGTAEQAISEEKSHAKGIEEKSKEFVESGAEVYAKAP
jgi:phosphomethylpyrimidine synthase